MTTRARKRQRLEATTPLLLPLAARLTASFLGARDEAQLALASRGVRAALRGAPLDLALLSCTLTSGRGSGAWSGLLSTAGEVLWRGTTHTSGWCV